MIILGGWLASRRGAAQLWFCKFQRHFHQKKHFKANYFLVNKHWNGTFPMFCSKYIFDHGPFSRKLCLPECLHCKHHTCPTKLCFCALCLFCFKPIVDYQLLRSLATGPAILSPDASKHSTTDTRHIIFDPGHGSSWKVPRWFWLYRGWTTTHL